MDVPVNEEEMRLARGGNKIDAIRAYWIRTGRGSLSDAKRAIETALNREEVSQEVRERWRPARYKPYTGEILSPGDWVKNPKIDAFLRDVQAVFDKHGLWLAHEDGHGAFEVRDGEDCNNIADAHDCTSGDQGPKEK